MLAEADQVIAIGLNEAAGRASYLAAYHAAQAWIFEEQDRVAKTHAGVQAEFHRLARNDSRIDEDVRGFLARAYELKAAADYDTRPDTGITAERAMLALELARRFLEQLATILAYDDDPNAKRAFER